MDDVSVAEPSNLASAFARIRAETEALVADLTDEDQVVQSMPDASPAKWHRAHTTWFFEEFVLGPNLADYEVFDPAHRFLFNSYYDAVGARHPRPMRGLLTRPAGTRITGYRAHVDAAMARLLDQATDPAVAALVELGLNHEQQHQELLVTDMLHAFSCSPVRPALFPNATPAPRAAADTVVLSFTGGFHRIGHPGPGFCFDNETPAHAAHVGPFSIASHLVRNAAYQAFIEDGGYDRSSLWMSDGWAAAQAGGWQAPLHWFRPEGASNGPWWQLEPSGPRPLDPHAPVRHVSWYEADAFARWSGARLPTEFEWEVAALHPGFQEATGEVWQWTESAYRPYPGFSPVRGAVGEYNGKFMINQMVLRGGSLATPEGHARRSYRNFFHPDKRWQFSGLRLAYDA